MLEVDPGVRVAPDEDGEEESGQGRRQQHDDHAEQAAVAQGHEGGVVGPERTIDWLFARHSVRPDDSLFIGRQ